MVRSFKAFTLVELLVVIGIIAVLISILLPALSRVRNQSQLVKCAAQMRNFSNAVHMYASENKDALPPFRWDNGSPTFSLWGSNGNGVTGVWTYRNTSAFSNANEDGNGLGRLIKTRHLPYSPDTGTVDRFLSCPNTKWDSGVSTWQSLYYFNPHIASRDVNGTRVRQLLWKKLSKHGILKHDGVWDVQFAPWTDVALDVPQFRRPLMTDPMYDLASSTHAFKDRRHWNMLYADGSVLTAHVDSKAQRMNGINNWQRLLDQLNYLAHVVDGGGNVTATGAPEWNKYYNAIPVNPK
ncbi:MAG: hypothetical protein KatS3mg104_0958 [Phycisphaerae bacterium]|jgi:prepilin-type N-terminal cleavage/methylation domain-containing protein|nr:MAG: hypothetical protein KatS3mg104_0958 [Phycisphaerae bacterium]